MIALLLMATIAIAPIEDAVRFHDAKTAVGAKLRTAEWQKVAPQLRNSAQFSAGVESVRVTQLIQDDIGQILSHYRNANGALTERSGFMRDLAELAENLGLRRGAGEGRGGLTDLGSVARTELIYQQQVSQAYGFAGHKAALDEDALDAAPAQELVRIRDAKQPRDWQARWAEAGGQLYGVRMIALKTSPVWTTLSRFGTPWPPFDFNSGMWTEDILRPEAEALGVIVPHAKLYAEQPALTDHLQLRIADLGDVERGMLGKIFGNQISFSGEFVKWIGGPA